MTRSTLTRQGALLQGYGTGRGAPVLFQHGLGGSEAQVAENVPDVPGFRRLTLDCRAQGGSEAGTTRPFSIAMFAEDVLAFCDAEGAETFVAGGTSMGAAIALRLAVLHAARVRALILARPAWLFDAAPPTMKAYGEVAAALRAAPAAEARAMFRASPAATLLAREAPDNLVSLLGFFDRTDPMVTADLLDAIAADGPGVTRQQVEAIAVPTLVIGHGIDHVHPLASARTLAETIPGARLVEIAPKAANRPAHVAGFRAAVVDFLNSLSA